MNALTPLEERGLAWLTQGDSAFAEVAPASDVGSLELAEAWTAFLVMAACEAASHLRSKRFGPLRDEVQRKTDGSPVTDMEELVENQFRRRVKDFDASATVMGEEVGGALAETGVSVAIDPLDGTWALLNRSSSFAVAIAAFIDRKPWLGLILQPATGEITYTAPDGQSRLVQLSAFRETPTAVDLPLEPAVDGGVLVDVHPSRHHGEAVAALHDAWRGEEIHMLRASGGSPSLALAEVARGRFVYLNAWGGRQAAAYDLAAGVLLVQGAGGQILNLAGEPVDPLAHQGPFIAGVDEKALEIIRRTLPNTGVKIG